MFDTCYCYFNMYKTKFFNWIKEEKGANEIIAVILILVVVVGLGIIFREKIMDLANKLWETITIDGGNASKSLTEGQ